MEIFWKYLICSAMDVGIPVDSPNLVLLFYVAQLFLRELHKSKNLIRIIPMDMSGYYGKSCTSATFGDTIIISKLFKELHGCRKVGGIGALYCSFFFY